MPLFSKLMDKRLAAYQRELTEIHYAEVENMYRQMRGWRHDYHNHIQVMKAHAGKGDWAALTAYLDGLETDLATVDTVVKTGNPMADAILNSKISLARARGIPVQADANIPVSLRLSPLDLCVILGNLFDNAMEASLALPEGQRLIRVYIDMKGPQLYISFTNFTACGKRPKLQGRFRSTKGAGHGFGLCRMDAIVGRLGGYLSRNSEDGAFTTEILLPQPAAPPSP
ncbi:sensor histidine kinase [Acutalibacter caecimuris]|uniref:sensor histidine kinase n=1 Tax=Acutalibacter caecimuris TaxID=3093657 RepID=UPI002AC93F88|nr:ATP-binding protein [Acutalibacter sp. M00118]